MEFIYKMLSEVDSVQMNFGRGGILYMNITLALIMFGVSLEIRIKNFKELFRNPKSPVLGVLSQFVLLPALTFGLVWLINPPPSIAMGMILISACPGGNISNFISAIAKANIELSVSLTAFATLVSTLLTPLNFAFWGGLYVNHYQKAKELNIPIEIDFLQMAQTVFILMGIPLVLGMIFARRYPRFSIRYIKQVKIVSIILYMTFVVGAFAANIEYFPKYALPVGILVMMLNIQTLGTGYLVGSVFKLSKPNRRTLSIETGIQNSGLALVLIFNPKLFNGNGGMALMAAVWGIWQMFTGIAIAMVLSRIPIRQK